MNHSKRPRIADDGPSPRDLRILAVIRGIPRGKVLTYADVARRASLPGRARLVGFVLRHCPLADAVPWHRVVAAPGRIALRGGSDVSRQMRRLADEGVVVSTTGRIDLKAYRWNEKANDRPKTNASSHDVTVR